MKTEINAAIKFLAEKIKGDITADQALKYTQAAQNLAHTAAVLLDNKRIEAAPK